jgi:hypothetical protein
MFVVVYVLDYGHSFTARDVEHFLICFFGHLEKFCSDHLPISSLVIDFGGVQFHEFPI